MAYQIKSTPFFRRIVSTSKKNGQLQRLKEEYDRIKEFNEHNIEMKMRQVRLKRLFREIEEIKESSSSFTRRRYAGQDRLKTMDEIRLETFVKAKELGKEYSKLNALMVERSSSKVEAAAIDAARLERDKRYLSAKRINYGNEMSRCNMEKAQFAPKPRVPRRFIKCNQVVDKKLEQYRQRLEYGNSQSSLNMIKSPKRTQKVKSTKPLPVIPEQIIDVKPQTESIISDEPTLIPQSPKETKKHKTFEELQKSQVRIIKNPPTQSEKNNRLRSKQLWKKLRLYVLYSNPSGPRRAPLPLNQAAEYEEFQLRSISNDTHLPYHKRVDRSDKNSPKDVESSSASTGNADEIDQVPGEADERLIRSENLIVKELTKKFERVQQGNSQPKADECVKLRNVFSHLQRQQQNTLPLPEESVQIQSQSQFPSQ